MFMQKDCYLEPLTKYNDSLPNIINKILSRINRVLSQNLKTIVYNEEDQALLSILAEIKFHRKRSRKKALLCIRNIIRHLIVFTAFPEAYREKSFLSFPKEEYVFTRRCPKPWHAWTSP
jgi:hypothetical protein